MNVDLSTIGKRLRWAIERRPAEGQARGIRKFQRDLTARAVELKEAGGSTIAGLTLPSVMSYLNDAATPSVEFIREASQLAGVRATWLAWGEGAPTQSEQDEALMRVTLVQLAHQEVRKDLKHTKEELEDPERKVHDLLAGIHQGFPQFSDMPEVARNKVFNVLKSVGGLLKDKDSAGAGYLQPIRFAEVPEASSPAEEIGQRLGLCLSAPFNILGIDPHELDTTAWALFVEALTRPIEIVDMLRDQDYFDTVPEEDSNGTP